MAGTPSAQRIHRGLGVSPGDLARLVGVTALQGVEQHRGWIPQQISHRGVVELASEIVLPG